MGCRNYDICSIDFMLPSYRHHPFCLICNVLTMICKRQFINTRIFFTFTTFFLNIFFYDLSSFTTQFLCFFVVVNVFSWNFFAHYSFLLSCCCRTVFILSFLHFVTVFFFLLYFLISLCCPVSFTFFFFGKDLVTVVFLLLITSLVLVLTFVDRMEFTF